jgi:hypothetical protein
MQSLLDVLSPGWVGSLIGLLGLGAAAAQYVVARVRPVLGMRSESTWLIGGPFSLPPDVEILFAGHKVDRVSVANVIVWNDGNTTLRGDDIVAADRLRIELEEDAKVLAVYLVQVTRPVINFRAAIDPEHPRAVGLSYDYLDRNDGAHIGILHTGKTLGVAISGSIKGMKQGPTNFGPISNPTEMFVLHMNLMTHPFTYQLTRVLMIAAAILALVVGLSPETVLKVFPDFGVAATEPLLVPNRIYWTSVMIGAVLSLSALVELFPRGRFPKSLTPDDSRQPISVTKVPPARLAKTPPVRRK